MMSKKWSKVLSDVGKWSKVLGMFEKWSKVLRNVRKMIKGIKGCWEMLKGIKACNFFFTWPNTFVIPPKVFPLLNTLAPLFLLCFWGQKKKIVWKWNKKTKKIQSSYFTHNWRPTQLAWKNLRPSGFVWSYIKRHPQLEEKPTPVRKKSVGKTILQTYIFFFECQFWFFFFFFFFFIFFFFCNTQNKFWNGKKKKKKKRSTELKNLFPFFFSKKKKK